MRLLHELPILARCFRAGLIALYAATALLGSGGLHAFAPPCGGAGCVAETHQHVHTHPGCTHSHPHSHSAPADAPQSETPCDHDHDHEHCFICQHAATAVVPVAVVVPPSIPEAVTDVNPHVETCAAVESAFRFLIRGPPATA